MKIEFSKRGRLFPEGERIWQLVNSEGGIAEMGLFTAFTRLGCRGKEDLMELQTGHGLFGSFSTGLLPHIPPKVFDFSGAPSPRLLPVQTSCLKGRQKKPLKYHTLPAIRKVSMSVIHRPVLIDRDFGIVKDLEIGV
jgi:hypothetical protein